MVPLLSREVDQPEEMVRTSFEEVRAAIVERGEPPPPFVQPLEFIDGHGDFAEPRSLARAKMTDEELVRYAAAEEVARVAEKSGRERVEADDDDDAAVRVEHVSVKSALACTDTFLVVCRQYHKGVGPPAEVLQYLKTLNDAILSSAP